MLQRTLIASTLLFSLVAVGALLWADTAPITFASMESRTLEGNPVYNRIRWFSFADKDVWMMQQSHHGLEAEGWDRLAIVIDKTQEPKVARYLQLEPGPLTWSEDLPTKPFRVSCFVCHTNGPRAIRPQGSLPLWQSLRVVAWNLRIKSYGRILGHDAPVEQEALAVRACTRCHDNSGWVARGPLTRLNASTIHFMVSSGQMPPPGFSLSPQERSAVDDFVRGF